MCGAYKLCLSTYTYLPPMPVVLPELPPAITAVGGEEEEGGASGVLAGFSSQQVELLFSPVQPSQHSAEFLLSFSHPTVPQVLRGGGGGGGGGTRCGRTQAFIFSLKYC